jgi:glycosyltransferase involved in cell wall biosynthesis
VITANTAAARELLRDGESALLVAPESPSELAAAIARLAGDEELRTSIATAGRRVYTESAACDVRGRQWRDLIEALLT